MTMIERLKADQMIARKAKDSVKVTLLSTLIGEVTKVGKDADDRDTTDAEAIAVIKKFKKNIEDTQTLIVKQNPECGNSTVNSLKYEISLYDSYIPKQLDAESLTTTIATLKLHNDNIQMKDIMGYLKANFAGLYDGKLASQIANQILKGN